MYFDTIEVAPLAANCSLLGDERERICAVVDPGGSTANIVEMVRRSGLRPAAILLTHGHYDHVGAVDTLLEAYPGLPVYIHALDLAPGEQERYRMAAKANQHTYEDGDSLRLGGLTVKVLHTPGHSPGSVALLAERVMLSGDTLFAGTCGRSDLPGGDAGQLTASLARLGRLSGDYQIIPGHGPATTLSREKQTNPFLRGALGL